MDFVVQYLLPLGIVGAIAITGISVGVWIARQLVRVVRLSIWNTLVMVACCFLVTVFGATSYEWFRANNVYSIEHALEGCALIAAAFAGPATAVAWVVIGLRSRKAVREASRITDAARN